MNLNYMSVASGISAETLAWGPLGWHPVSFAQFDPEHKYKHGPDFASAVLAHHYPTVPNLGDMNNFAEWPDANVDVLTGGTPCQTYSLAGLGAGLDDPRGDLALVYAAIARRYRPKVIIWENVVGVLSNDQGRAFASILGLLSGQRIEVPSGGWRTAGVVPGIARAYGLAWRVLNTEFVRIHGFGRALPQRRRRVFVVGYLGDWRRAAAVLLERESLLGNPPPRRRPGEKASGSITRSFGIRGGVDEGERGTLIPDVANPLTARMFKGVNTTMDEGQTMIPHPAEVSPPLMSGQNITGGNRFPGTDIDTVESLLPISFNARQDPIPNQDGATAGPLDQDGFSQAIAFKPSHFTRGKDGAPSDVAPPLSADADKGDQDTEILQQMPPVAAPLTAGSYNIGGRRKEDDENLVASAFQPRFARNDRGGPIEEVAYPLTAEAGRTGKGDSAQCIQRGWSVRRLMPIECERLQGVPDDFTLIPWRGKLAADGPRYKVLGNMQSINVIRWLGWRIERMLEIE